jgi:hypothetical protein
MDYYWDYPENVDGYDGLNQALEITTNPITL